MSISTHDATAVAVSLDDQFLAVTLRDGRQVLTPLTWFPRLLSASTAERADWRFIGDGEGIHWATLDEDISVAGLLKTS